MQACIQRCKHDINEVHENTVLMHTYYGDTGGQGRNKLLSSEALNLGPNGYSFKQLTLHLICGHWVQDSSDVRTCTSLTHFKVYWLHVNQHGNRVIVSLSMHGAITLISHTLQKFHNPTCCTFAPSTLDTEQQT